MDERIVGFVEIAFAREGGSVDVVQMRKILAARGIDVGVDVIIEVLNDLLERREEAQLNDWIAERDYSDDPYY
jgi:hypothetical protein